ncbi:beta-hydroxyacyl-ACP dehydratase [Pseudoflavonifractor sp. MCC625]|uniref:3-hydroxyacyl-ACP dehydratase FabZ family protein n=1 Tax=Pseudoflavonifractor sp. MCC625 TaxID=2592647 RepID=UPI001C020FB4|nr:beta-hydroxyacyl-ACP dehydratase [Pseudoflavonifractor sp. MCC625]MBT9683783.1 beta-hydroxyacyl-ACP dehydratase [Pseudoflavonifractor sp. MCC625]
MTLTLEEIKSIIPQRPPILLVDEVSKLIPGDSIETRFYVSPDMSVFQGHFPGNPVLPGVYSVEALAQTADILLLSLERYQGMVPLFMGIDQMRFKHKILPGVHLRMTARITHEDAVRRIISCETAAYQADRDILCAIGVLTLAMR